MKALVAPFVVLMLIIATGPTPIYLNHPELFGRTR